MNTEASYNITEVVTSGGNNSTEESCTHVPGMVSVEAARGLANVSANYASIHGYIAVAVCLFGILSNSANILVLTRKNMLSSTNTLLMWLAVSDLLTMLSYLPFAIHFYVIKPGTATFSTPEFPWICFLMFHASFAIVCHTIAIWLTIALAIFRYIYICKPTSGTYYCSQQRAVYVVALIFLLTVIICIPNYIANTIEVTYVEVNVTGDGLAMLDPLSNLSQSLNGSDAAYSTKKIPFYYPGMYPNRYVIKINYWIQAILMKLVPCGMLTTLTLLLVHAMHKAYRKRLRLKSQGRKMESDKHGEHNRVTSMLLAVVVLFTLTELPQGILTLMAVFLHCFYEVVYSPLGDFVDIMALINNSVNFVLYCTMSTQFRNTFTVIFCPRRPSRPKWLKLRLITSRRDDKSSIEAMDGGDKGKRGSRANSNGRLQKDVGVAMNNANNGTNKPLAPETGNKAVLNNVNEPAVCTHEQDHDKVPLTPEGSNANCSSHTHGISPEHTHV